MNCKSSFFKDTVLGNKDVKILSFDNLDVDTTVSNESISSPSPSICSIMPGRSKVISLGYTSSLDEKYCVICNKVQYKATTRAPLLLRTLDLKKHGDDLNEAEKTSIEFANIHKEKGTKYADAGERILLSLNTISAFFPTDAAFHAKCYHTFRSPSWKIESKNLSRNSEDLDEFVSVIEDLVVCRKEVYTMSQLWDLYCKIGDHANVRAIYIKILLQKQLLDKVQF